jgi:hypothetical protein
VLARIPDVRSSGRERADDAPLNSRGRILGQAVSFRLLAAATVILLIAAIVPYNRGTKGPTTEPPTVADATAEWRAAPTPTPSAVVQPPAKVVPVAQITAQSGGSITAPTTPGVLPQPDIKPTAPRAFPADAPLMTEWSPPSQPTSDTLSTGNPTTPARLTPYQADIRAGPTGGDPQPPAVQPFQRLAPR